MNQDLNPIQIPIKPCCNLAVMSCLVTFSALELAYNPIRRYSSLALSKISKLAVEGYKFSLGAQSAIWTFFVRIISMRSHVMAKLERDTFKCTGNLVSLSSNPFQLCHPHLEVNGKALKQSLGAHSHA